MSNLIVAILAGAVIYIVPGFLLLGLTNLRISFLLKIFLSICISIIFVPLSFLIVGNFAPFIPGITPLLILCCILIILRIILKRTNHIISVQPDSIVESFNHPQLIEKIFVWSVIIFSALIFNLPRIAMFIQGDQTIAVSPWDETWHLAELTSVARTGIPPHHYLFPSLKLVYYYISWIYPAILGNLPLVNVSLARAMSIHAFLQIFLFLGTIYYFLSANFKSSWARIFGILSFTVIGGFDAYASLPNINSIDWWAQNAKWIVSNLQISQFPTLYNWVPQHLAGAIAFIFGLYLWKNTKVPTVLKVVITAVLLSFTFLTSPFVFIPSTLAFIFFAVYSLKARPQSPARVAGYLVLMALIFLAASWYPILIFSGSQGRFGLNTLYVPILEYLRGNQNLVTQDRILTLLGFPLVAGWIALIEIGIPFILYTVWLIKKLMDRKRLFSNAFDCIAVILPILYFLLIFIVRDIGGGGNFSMRGMIPSQILINLAGLYVLEEIDYKKLSLPRLIALGYIFICFIVAQGFSTAYEVRDDASGPVKSIVNSLLRSVKKDGQDIPADFEYVHWVNANTPRNSLILEDGCAVQDSPTYRWIERARFITPDCARKLQYFERDRDFIQVKEWDQLDNYIKSHANLNILELTASIPGISDLKNPLYVVEWNKDSGWLGKAAKVYQDDFVSIFRVR